MAFVASPKIQQGFHLLLGLALFFVFSCNKIVPPNIRDFSIVEAKMIDSKSSRLLLQLDLENPNSVPLNLTLTDLRVYQAPSEMLSMIDGKKEDGGSLELTNLEPISAIDSAKNFSLAKETNTLLNLTVILQNEALLSSLLNLVLNQKINLFFKGNIVFHHWSGTYPIPIQYYLPFDLKQILK